MANSLTLGCDCLGVIHYFDAVVPDVFGAPRTIENCICLHEEDAGLSWKHFDVRTRRTEVRRARKLVVSSISTIGNYEYASYWSLHQDGRIEYEMKATGIINTAACHPGHPGKYGTEVAPGLVGHIHQHVFSARLDMEVDGPDNTVVECDTVAPPPGPDNPYGNAFYVAETVLRTELAARRDAEARRVLEGARALVVNDTADYRPVLDEQLTWWEVVVEREQPRHRRPPGAYAATGVRRLSRNWRSRSSAASIATAGSRG